MELSFVFISSAEVSSSAPAHTVSQPLRSQRLRTRNLVYRIDHAKQEIPAFDGNENVKLVPAVVAVTDANGVATVAQVGAPEIPVLSVVGVSVIKLPDCTAVVLMVYVVVVAGTATLPLAVEVHANGLAAEASRQRPLTEGSEAQLIMERLVSVAVKAPTSLPQLS